MRNYKIYFVQEVNGEPIKIGRTKDISQRLSTLQYEWGNKFNLIHLYEDDLWTESDIHQFLRKYNQVGEWFHAPETLLFIDCYLYDEDIYKKWKIKVLKCAGALHPNIAIEYGLLNFK